MIVPLLLRNSYRFSHHNSKYSANKNYYSVLKIPHNSTKDAIKNAFIGLAKKYHPDLNPHGKQQFILIKEAYQVLSNAQEKKNYDQFYEEVINCQSKKNGKDAQKKCGKEYDHSSTYKVNKQYRQQYSSNQSEKNYYQYIRRCRRDNYNEWYGNQENQQYYNQRQPFTFEQNEQQMKQKWLRDKKMREQLKKIYDEMIKNQFTTTSKYKNKQQEFQEYDEQQKMSSFRMRKSAPYRWKIDPEKGITLRDCWQRLKYFFK